MPTFAEFSQFQTTRLSKFLNEGNSVATMNKYNYQISDKTGQEVWVCEACKKGKTELILTGKWKLIDRSGDSGVPCAICEGDKAAEIKAGSAAAKNES